MMPESRLGLLLDVRRALKGGRPALEARQRKRLAEMASFARENSRFYREHYAGLPENVDRLDVLAPVTKPMRMERFDDWVTDPAVTHADVQAFIGNPENAGLRYRGEYGAHSTSGTSGYRGVFPARPAHRAHPVDSVDSQAAGRLNIRPVLVSVTAESLYPHEYDGISEAFGVQVNDNYGCTEAPELSSYCRGGWNHYNMDWHGFEPVDTDYRPVPPGEHSHTVLLTNLINRVQPILRYDLGDSVLMRPDPCPCGSPLPSFRVVGRPLPIGQPARKPLSV